MKKFFKNNKKQLLFILGVIISWRAVLFIPFFLGQLFLAQRQGYIGIIPWGNFDGVHYLSIAQNGYFQYEQAFFPFFPLLIRYGTYITFGNYVSAALFLVHIALFIWLFIFYKLLQLDHKENTVRWIIIFYLFSPTGFFFGSLYTETVFLLLVIGAFYAARKEKWILAAICMGLASSTKFVGIFLLPAILFEFYLVIKKHPFSVKNLSYLFVLIILGCSGLIAYMVYLLQFYHDPLFFIHAQSAFGANRTGGAIVLLPQVIYRYIKIFITVPFTNYDIWIALLEFSMFFGSLGILIYGTVKKQIRISYAIFSFLAILGPTLTGSLSSMPRYVLVGFPIFICLGIIKNKIFKIILVTGFTILLMVLSIYFLRGYFIA